MKHKRVTNSKAILCNTDEDHRNVKNRGLAKSTETYTAKAGSNREFWEIRVKNADIDDIKYKLKRNSNDSGIIVTMRDVETLSKSAFLNDVIINWYTKFRFLAMKTGL